MHSIYKVSTVCREELLYLLNLKALGLVKVRQAVAGDQGWINEVYLWEKFNIGLQYNLRTGVVQVSTHQAPSYLLYPCIYLSAQMPGMSGWMRNASVFHFAWLFKPDHCHTRHPMAPACTLWQQYRQTLDW